MKKIGKSKSNEIKYKLFESRSMIEQKNIYFLHDGIKKIQVSKI